MKKFRKVLDGLTTSSPGGTIGSPSCGSAAGTPTAAPTPKEIDVQETLVSENFLLCKVSRLDKDLHSVQGHMSEEHHIHHICDACRHVHELMREEFVRAALKRTRNILYC